MQQLTQLQLILAARDTVRAIKPVELVSENVSTKTAATLALDGLERWMRIAAQEYDADQKAEKDAASQASPFLIHRDKVLENYSTARRLQDLVLNLANGAHACDLAMLFCGADSHHRAAALQMITATTRGLDGDAEFHRLVADIKAWRKGEA